jgi:hypothetical protein
MSAPTPTETPPLHERLVSAINQDMKEGAQSDQSPEVTEAAPEEEESQEQEVAEAGPEDSQASDQPEEAVEEADDLEAAAEPGAAEDEIEITDDVGLAEALGATPEEIHSLKITVGEEKIPLSELVSRAQSAPLQEQVLEATGEERLNLGNLTQAITDAFAKEEASWIALTNQLISELEGPQYSNEALAKLKTEDESEWMVKSEEKRQLTGKIERFIRAAREHRTNLEAMRTPADQEYDKIQAMELSKTIPNWENPDTAMWEATIIGRFLQEHYGIPQELIEHPATRHAGFCRALYDAHRMYRVEQGAAKTKKILKKKKVGARRSVIATRARRTPENKRDKQFAALRKRQRETARSVDHAGSHADASRRALGHFLPE